jgi:hypothetical protein
MMARQIAARLAGIGRDFPVGSHQEITQSRLLLFRGE